MYSYGTCICLLESQAVLLIAPGMWFLLQFMGEYPLKLSNAMPAQSMQ